MVNDEIPTAELDNTRIEAPKPLKKKSSWPVWLFILVPLVLAVVTKPSKEQHLEKIKEIMIEQSDGDIFTTGLSVMFGSFIIENSFYIDDYVLFNYGCMKDGDEEVTLTLGLFNSVIPLKLP